MCCEPKEGQSALEADAQRWTTPVFLFGVLQFLGFFSGNWSGGLAGVLCIAAGSMVLNAQPGRMGATNYLTATILLCFVILIDVVNLIMAFVLISWLNGVNCDAAEPDSTEETVCETRGGVRFVRSLVIVAMVIACLSVFLLSTAVSRCMRARDYCMRRPPFAGGGGRDGTQMQTLDGMPVGASSNVAVAQAMAIPDSQPVYAVQGVAVLAPPDGVPQAQATTMPQGAVVQGSAVPQV